MPWATAATIVGITGVITTGIVQVAKSNRVHEKRKECEVMHQKLMQDFADQVTLKNLMDGRLIKVETSILDGTHAFARIERSMEAIDSKIDQLIFSFMNK